MVFLPWSSASRPTLLSSQPEPNLCAPLLPLICAYVPFQAYAQIVLLPLCSPQILSVFPKYVGLFSKNVGDFLKNVGDFLNYLRRFFCVLCIVFFSYSVLFLLVFCVVFFLFMRSFLLMYVLSMLPLLLLIALLREDVLWIMYWCFGRGDKNSAETEKRLFLGDWKVGAKWKKKRSLKREKIEFEPEKEYPPFTSTNPLINPLEYLHLHDIPVCKVVF